MLLNLLNQLHNHGGLYLLALFLPVSWIQDSTFKNRGHDILSLKKSKGYFTGTTNQRNTYLNRIHSRN